MVVKFLVRPQEKDILRYRYLGIRYIYIWGLAAKNTMMRRPTSRMSSISSLLRVPTTLPDRAGGSTCKTMRKRAVTKGGSK